MVGVLRETIQVARRPTLVLAARSLETDQEALILTTPLNVAETPQFLNLAAGWYFNQWAEQLRPDPHGLLRDRYGI